MLATTTSCADSVDLQLNCSRHYPTPAGKQTPSEFNQLGQKVLDELLTSPKTAVRSYASKNYGAVVEYIGPKSGARFTDACQFIGFL
jgi:hypothetical protein